MIDEEHKQENSFIDAEMEEVDASVTPGEETKLDVTEEDLANFIGDRAETYFPKFRKFRIDEPDKFSFTWNWAAFFFTFVWLAYRRMYAWALITLLYPIVHAFVFLLLVLLLRHEFSLLMPLLVLKGILYFLPNIALGLAGNHLYFRHSMKRILNWKRTDRKVPLHRVGGVNFWAGIIAFIVWVVPILRLSQGWEWGGGR